jgi:D-arabinose 1-dehydrogenase-like Zn-dependent alcohol dehydrogenase
MKAAVLKKFGSPLVIEDVPNPKLGTGEAIVDVAAAPVHGSCHGDGRARPWRPARPRALRSY